MNPSVMKQKQEARPGARRTQNILSFGMVLPSTFLGGLQVEPAPGEEYEGAMLVTTRGETVSEVSQERLR